MQSVMVGMGAITASSMPWLLNHLFQVDSLTTGLRRIPLTVEIAFYVGAGLFLSTILWTVCSTPERPPDNLEQFKALKDTRGGLGNSLQQILAVLTHLPKTMLQLAGVQVFTWLGIFCFFIYFPPAVARNIFRAVDLNSPLYNSGIEWAGLCFAVFNAVCILFSFLLPLLARCISRKLLHCLCLICGGAGLILVGSIDRPSFLLIPMVGFGMAWASAQSIPYAILTHTIPTQQRGIYQGIFNFFIVLPEIGISLTFGWVMQSFLHDDRLLAVELGGGFLAIAALLTLFVQTADGVKDNQRADKGKIGGDVVVRNS
jgi:maltose/moltooligosaccharide transporter